MARAARLLLVPPLAALAGCASPKGEGPVEKRAAVNEMREEVLQDLYAARPEARRKIDEAAGYGVFSNIGTSILFVSTGGGYGVVHDNDTGEDTYMRMGEFGVGLGVGVKDFRAVFVFHDEATLEKFVEEGWEFGAEADAAAQASDSGGAAAAAGTADDDITVYQFTENGLILGGMVGGSKFWVDRDLN